MTNFPSKHKKDAEEATGLLFMRTYNTWHGEIKRQLRAIGLTHPQFVVLASLGYLLQNEEEITQIMLANMAGMDVASVSQIIRLVESHGWLIRKQHRTDTRAKSLTLTQKGQNKLVHALPIVENIDHHFFGSLGKDEHTFLSLLHTLMKSQSVD